MKIRDKIELVKLNDLLPYPKNAKKHDESQIKKLMHAIQNFGFTTPILIDEHRMIISGHGRIKAARRLGMEEVPAIQITDLTDAQIKALRISDNKIAESDWDMDILKEEFEDLKTVDFDLSLTGFNVEKDFFSDEKKKNTSKNPSKIIHSCPKCGHEFSGGKD